MQNRVRSERTMPPDFDRRTAGMRSERRIVTRWRPRSAAQRVGSEQDLIDYQRPQNGRLVVERQLLTSRSGSRLEAI